MSDARNTEDMSDLDHLDALLWGANPHTRRGDLVLMYRTRPFRDIAYVFRAASNPRPTRPDDRADTKYVIDLDQKIALPAPIRRAELRRRFKTWGFVRHARGQMRRAEDLVAEGVWPALNDLIARRNHGLDVERWASGAAIDEASGFRWHRLRVFFSYARDDKRRAQRIYTALTRLRGVDVWRDDERIAPGVAWERMVRRAIEVSDVVVICLSRRALRAGGYVRREINLALRAADARSGNMSIVPVKLEPCAPDPRLRRWQWLSLSRDGDGLLRLLQTVRQRARRHVAASRRRRRSPGSSRPT